MSDPRLILTALFVQAHPTVGRLPVEVAWNLYSRWCRRLAAGSAPFRRLLAEVEEASTADLRKDGWKLGWRLGRNGRPTAEWHRMGVVFAASTAVLN